MKGRVKREGFSFFFCKTLSPELSYLLMNKDDKLLLKKENYTRETTLSLEHHPTNTVSQLASVLVQASVSHLTLHIYP